MRIPARDFVCPVAASPGAGRADCSRLVGSGTIATASRLVGGESVAAGGFAAGFGLVHPQARNGIPQELAAGGFCPP